MTLQEIIRRITEAENSLCNELKKDDLGFSADYRYEEAAMIKEKIKTHFEKEKVLQ